MVFYYENKILIKQYIAGVGQWVDIDEDGNVYMAIDASGILPENADWNTVTVQHHEEKSDGGVTVETVVDTADETSGVVTVADETTVQAAFGVNGFLTFTILWGNSSQTYFQVTVHYVDVNGNEINGTQQGI